MNRRSFFCSTHIEPNTRGPGWLVFQTDARQDGEHFGPRTAAILALGEAELRIVKASLREEGNAEWKSARAHYELCRQAALLADGAHPDDL